MPRRRSVNVIASADDTVAALIAAEFTKRGVFAEWIDGPAAARRFTLSTSAAGVRVTPLVPIFYRNSAWYSVPTVDVADSDAAFLRDECYAAIWAAAYSMPLSVINRPTLSGFRGRLTSSSFTVSDCPENRAAYQEHFASGPEELTDLAGVVWAEMSNYDSADLTSISRSAPLRARSIKTPSTYTYIVVIGTRALVRSPRPGPQLKIVATRSVALVRHYKLGFATVIWACNNGDYAPIRLNPDPGIEDILGLETLVLDYLIEELLA